MKFDVEYLAGLEIAEQDGKARVLKVPFAGATGELEETFNNLLLALQAQGYEVLSAVPATGMLDEKCLWITYR